MTLTPTPTLEMVFMLRPLQKFDSTVKQCTSLAVGGGVIERCYSSARAQWRF
jgi:hypothetical protein